MNSLNAAYEGGVGGLMSRQVKKFSFFFTFSIINFFLILKNSLLDLRPAAP